MWRFGKLLGSANKIAEDNVPAPAPIRSDEQILPFNAWLPVRKGNILLDLQKLQKNPIFRISFTLTAELLRNALEITPVDSAHPFVSPPTGEHVMIFMNELGYPEEIHFVSKMHVNNLYQSWRAILSLINLCLTCKTSGNDKPIHHVLQMLWGIVTRSNVKYAKLLWEKFVQAIQTFFSHRANLSIPTNKPTPYVIPYCRFTKLIIYYSGSRHNIHRRSESVVHVMRDDFLLGNLKFVPKGEKDEVFPKDLITEAIQQSPYYQQYLEMVARKTIAKEGGQKKTATKADKPKKPTPAKQPTLSEQTKLVKEKTSKPTPSKKTRKGKVMKVCKEKRSGRLASVHGVAIREPASGITQRLPVFEGKGKGIATYGQVAQSLLELHKLKPQSTTDQYIFYRRIPKTHDAPTRPSTLPHDDTSTNVVRDTLSPVDANAGADMEKSNNEDEDQAGSNLGPSHVTLARPNPKPMHEDFITTVYPKVHKSLKHTTEEHVFLENPPSSSGTLSSMKNLDDAFTFGNQFIDDKPTKEEPGKANVESEVESMVTVPIHQVSSSAPPLSTPIIDLITPKPDKTTQALSSRVFSLEYHDLYSKIDNYVNETVKEAVQNILQAPVPLYDALEASMDHKNQKEFINATTKSRKRRHDDQDPSPPPLKDSDQSKKKRNDSDASASKQPQAQTSSAWKTSDTIEAPSSSSKHKTAP
ncbi:hypothetical protein Tco_0928207 [Tanacetum coccineum]